MKKLKYFFASAIVLVAVAVSTIVFAEYKEQKGDIRFGNTISNNSITVTEGNLVEQGDIQINKTVSKIDDNGNYKVTFEVKGKDIETHTSNKKDVYAVVVLDKSNSMCNSYNCSRDEKWTSAVNGAKTFAKTLHEKLPNAKIALVTFADKDGFLGIFDNAYNDAQVLRNFDNKDFSNVNFGTPNGGTNLYAGLYEANELLTASNIKKDAIKYVVVISDGEPTLYYDEKGYTDGPGSYMDATTEAKTKEMAKTVQKSAEVFAIGYDYNGTILSEVASGADHVYLSDPKTIVTKFTDIATIMGKANAGTDATLTDNIGAKFVMTDAQGNKYTSEKFDITEAGKTFSFNIKINEEDITEDGWYSTNADFELTYTDPKGNAKTIHSNKNPEVYWVAKRYDYKIEYYYNGKIDNSKTESSNAKYETVISTYPDKKEVGYKLEKTENLPLTVSEDKNKNVINVYYVTDEKQTKELSYTVEYYKDGKKVANDTQVVKETKQVLESDTLTVKKGEINVTDKYVGYSFVKTEPSTIPNSIENKGIIRVYYERNSYDYEVHYFFNGNEDESLIETKSAKYNDVINTYTDKVKTGYKLQKAENLPLTIGVENNIINVYYVTDNTQTKELSYTVEYYKDGKKVVNDTQKVTETKQVLESDTLTVKNGEINVTNKYVGYKFEKTNPETIPNSINNKGVIKVYYVFDENQTKELSYTVEYYKNGKKVENDTQVEVVTVHVLEPNTLQVNQDKINTENKYVGYKLEKTNPESIPSEINNGGIIKVYYILDDGQTKTLTYTVNYYKDGNLVKEDTETIYETKQVLESDTLTVKSEEINIKDKYVGYKFVKTNPELIPEVIENKGVIDVYYEKDTFTYEVRYYFNRELDESLTEKGTALFGDKITSYTDKVKEDYTLETVENLPLVISEDESKNIINVYYKIDGQGVIEPIEPPHTSANNSIYALILLVNALGASVLLKKREN